MLTHGGSVRRLCFLSLLGSIQWRIDQPRPRGFMQLAHPMLDIGIESAFEVLVKARALEKQGKSVIHLEIGEPDFPTPRHVIEAGQKALAEGWTKYGASQGDPQLRESIAAYISRTRNIKVGAEHVVVTPGAKPIMYF